MLSEESPGIVAGNRRAANIVNHNLDAAAVKLNQPTSCRRRQGSSILSGVCGRLRLVS
jgi:hypothetical protein